MIHYFETSNEKSKVFEEAFAIKYNKEHQKKKIIWLNTPYDADYLIKTDKTEFKAEIKFDFKHYTNYFFEDFSNLETQRIGGVWSAQKYGCKYFLYLFLSPSNPNQYSCSCFLVDELIQWLNEHRSQYRYGNAVNKGEGNNPNYNTGGIIVPVLDLRDKSFVKIRRVELQN